jgi:Transposase, Mutator family
MAAPFLAGHLVGLHLQTTKPERSRRPVKFAKDSIRHRRRDFRSGSYSRKLQTQAGEVTLKVPKLRHQAFETAIIERYRRRETSGLIWLVMLTAIIEDSNSCSNKTD